MSYIAALFANGKVVTGITHGDAYTKLAPDEQNSCTSGFLDQTTGRFVTEDENTMCICKKMVFIRHAEYNTPFLTCNGLHQAKRTAEFLSTLDLSEFVAFSSPYRRCQQTSAIIGAFTDIRFNTEPALGEQHENENSPEFHCRLNTFLDKLPWKSIMITHCDVIAEMTSLSTGNNTVGSCRIPYGSLTYVNQGHIIWFGRNLMEGA